MLKRFSSFLSLGRKRHENCSSFDVYFKLYTDFFLCFLNGVIHSALFSFTMRKRRKKILKKFYKEHDIAKQHDKINFQWKDLFYLLKNHRRKSFWLMAELQHSTQRFPSKNSFQFSWIKQKFNSVCGIYSKRWGKMANGKCRFSTPKHVIGTGWCRMTQHKIKYCAIIHRWYSKIHRISYFNAGINLWYSWLFSVVPASRLNSALRDIPHIILLVLRLRNIFIYVNRKKTSRIYTCRIYALE